MWDRFSDNLGLVGFLPVWSMVFFGGTFRISSRLV